MKKFLLSLAMALALCVTSTFAQKTNLIGTTWILKYTTGKANSNDYQEYAKLTFKQGGKVEFNNGETGTWTLAGSKLTIQNDGDTELVHYVEATITGNTGSGNSVLGESTAVPFWVRLVKQNLTASQSGVTLKTKPPGSIRQIDFKNFTYRTPVNAGRDFSIRLRNGSYKEKVSPEEPEEIYETSFDRIVYGDLTGDGNEEALIVLLQEVSASSYEQYVYIYTVKNNEVSKLTAFVGGTSGCLFEGEECSILEVNIVKGLLVIDRGIPTDRDAKCCPSLHRSTKYRWNGNRIVEIGKTPIVKRPSN